MRVMLLFYGRAYSGTGAPTPPEQFQRIVEAHLAYERDVLRPHATVVLGQALAPAVTARTVAFPAGGPTVTDGPAVDTDEALGGFYVIECRDLDEARALAARYPMPPGFGTVEIRPVIGFDPALREQVLAGASPEPAAR
jgi:hypothetical protein